jgi:hypothetical protein
MPLVVHAHRHVPDLPLVERHGRALCRAPDQMVVRHALCRVPDQLVVLRAHRRVLARSSRSPWTPSRPRRWDSLHQRCQSTTRLVQLLPATR